MLKFPYNMGGPTPSNTHQFASSLICCYMYEMAMERAVYFKLVGAQPLPEIPVDPVNLREDASVIQFRKAVWNDVRRLLPSHVIAPTLRVYGNQVLYEADKQLNNLSGFGTGEQTPIIVEVPQPPSGDAGVTASDASIQSFNSRLGLLRRTNTAVPLVFRTLRSTLVDAFINLFFPTSGDYRPLLFIRAPPLSGKSVLCDLLCARLLQLKPQLLVARVLANDKPMSTSFSDYFKSIYQCDLDVFWGLNCERVVFIDNAQITYDDEQLWSGLLKNVYERRYEGLRIVLFASYGSYDSYGRHERMGTPMAIDQADTFSLSRSDTKPGLELSRAELNEMVGGNIAAEVYDLIWNLSSVHIGIAHAILTFLDEELRNKPPESINASVMELALRSSGLLEYIKAKRGMPTVRAFERVVQIYDLPVESRLKMSEVMHNVASGNMMHSSDDAWAPRSQAAVELLIQHGFIYEDASKQLQFASNMHLKVWLYANRVDPIGYKYMVSEVQHDDFVVACVKRMSAARLNHFATGNVNTAARGRQIQMELYRATTSCLPRDVLVTPEWSTHNGKGCIDLVIRGMGILWFWELLVNDDGAVGHSKRFESGDKYHGSLARSSKYGLIDFRQDKAIRDQKYEFLYVSFVDSNSKALIFGKDKPVVSVELSA